MESRQESSDNFITSSMISFINRSIKSAQLSSLDDIVFNYVETVLESLATESGALQDCFDVEEFCEILSAYFPEFSSIPHPIVSQWIFDMVTALKESTKKDKPLKEPVAFETLLCEIETEREPRSKRNSESSSDSSSYCSYNGKKSSSSRTTQVSETSESEADVADIIHRFQMCQLEHDEKMQTLMEMFPNLVKTDAQNYISITKGDLEKAVQMVLIQMETGEIANTPQSANLPGRPRICGAKSLDVDEKTLKDRIVARYGFIDQAEDAKEFRPPPPKAEPKKLVRYRESQVVTTKGERYSEVRGMKDAEETRTKNYLNKGNRHN